MWFQAGRIASSDIGTAVFWCTWVDQNSTQADPADHRSADLAGSEGFEQDREPPLVETRGRYAREQHSVLKLLQVIARCDNRSDNAKYIEAVAITSRIVADLDDASLPPFGILGTFTIEEFATGVAGCLEEGVVGCCRDLQFLAREHGF
jgi:hypothetical protein